MVNIEIDGRSHGVTVDRIEDGGHRFRVSWDGRTFTVDAELVDAHTLSCIGIGEACDSNLVRFADTSTRDEVDVHLEGCVVRVGVNRRRVGDSRRGPGTTAGSDGVGGQQVCAPMPGKVVRVLVAPGEQVEAGQGVVVIEAMKMENELTVSRAGRVAELRVDEGMLVETGKVLVVIE